MINVDPAHRLSASEVLDHTWITVRSGPKVIKLFSCSTQLSMKFSLLINMKMPTKIGIFIFISRKKLHAQLCSARKNLQLLVIWDSLAGQISCSAELSMKKVL